MVESQKKVFWNLGQPLVIAECEVKTHRFLGYEVTSIVTETA